MSAHAHHSSISSKVQLPSDRIEGLEYATQGGWLPAVSTLIRWLRAAGCFDYVHRLEREVQSLPAALPPAVEVSALKPILDALARLRNEPPNGLTSEQRKELVKLRRGAIRFVQYRLRQLADARQAEAFAVGNLMARMASSADEAAAPPNVESSPGRTRMTPEEANKEALKVAKRIGRPFFAFSETRQAKLIGCHWKTWTKTEFYPAAQARRPAGKKSKPASPRTHSLTAAREAVISAGKKDDILNGLIAEQQADKEPSPLDSDKPDHSRRVYSSKRL